MGQLVFQANSGGQTNLVGQNTASTFNLNIPLANGTLVSTGDTATVTSAMISGPVTTAKGGTGLTSFSSGGAVYATSTSALTTGTLPTSAGGTNLTSFTANGVVYASSSSALTTGSALTFDGSKLVAAGSNEAIRVASAAPYINFYNAAQTTQYGYIQHTGTDFAVVNVQNGAIPFYTNNTERARIDSSGNLLVGQTSSGAVNSNSWSFTQSAAGQLVGNHASGSASGSYYIGFYYNTTGIGSISQAGTTGILYNVTSDQRLKENIVDAESSSALIDAIQVRQYDWKSDGSHQRYGFIAQELVTVAPEAVHQPANPEDMMAVDYSKLVPMLVKEIQSLRKRLAALEAK